MLYNALHHSYQSVLDHEIVKGNLSLDADTHRQKAVVEQIINMIGRETPLETIDRVLNTYHNVQTLSLIHI